jgi:hypothetical protein
VADVIQLGGLAGGANGCLRFLINHFPLATNPIEMGTEKKRLRAAIE